MLNIYRGYHMYNVELVNKIKLLNGKYRCICNGSKYNDLKNEIQIATDWYPISISLVERCRLILLNINDPIMCKCGCGTVISPEKTFAKFHHLRTSECLAKRQNTYLNKYGVDNPSQSKEIQEKKKTTMVRNYGSTFMQSDVGKEAVKLKMMERYGVQNAFQIPKVKEKIGKKWQKNKVSILKKRQISRQYNFLKNLDEELQSQNIQRLFSKEEYFGVSRIYKYPFKCTKCLCEFTSTIDDGEYPVCKICNPNSIATGTSNMQKEIEAFIRTIYVGKIEIGSRTIIPPNELDIYLPDLKIAIEFDGIYWHSEKLGKDSKYHLNKTNECRSMGIQLIHIFENEWVYNKNIVKSRLRNILKANKYSIYGRRCTISEIDQKTCSKFLNKYHLQGGTNSSIRLGAFYKNRLISVMTFSKSRFDKKGGYELVRFATIRNFNCVGIAGKLLKHFEKKYSPVRIVTYADLRWSTGNLYRTIGFTFKNQSLPNYFYFKGTTELYSRMKFQKHKLYKILPSFDPTKTEWENMKSNGYNRIWDCGNLVFEKTDFKYIL